MTDNVVDEELSRVIGLVEGINPGPQVVALGGMHGNEPAGVKALEQVIDNLEQKGHLFNGNFLALRGNMEALKRGVRFIDEDMNRIWFPSIIEKIRRMPEEEIESNERSQIKLLLHILDEFLQHNSAQPTIFADLHSFSAEGNMFAITAPKESHIRLFSRLHVPLIFGIEKTLRGAALSYYQDQGHITFVLEGGQHQSGDAVQNNTAATLAMLDEVGCLDTSDLPAFKQHASYLARENKRLPEQVELVYQHMIEEGDQFEMRPGFANFQRIHEGQWLATDKDGKISAQYDGYLLMPLYQKQGNDGFFIVEERQAG